MYDFDAGDLSLDFANTKNWHASKKPVEELTSYADLITWGEEAGLVTPEFASRLRQVESERPREALLLYDHAIQVREAIYRIFSRLYARQPILESDLEILNSVVRKAMGNLHLAPNEGKFNWRWAEEIDSSDRILWSVARAAAELLTSDKAGRVRECEDDRGCGFLFIDQTKNHSRRWCSMDSCGNRAKAKRHYSRVQTG